MVTNQSGIGRGYYGWTEFKSVQDAIVASLTPQAPGSMRSTPALIIRKAKGLLAHPDHPARKPNPGMLLQAAADLALDLKASWLVGDKADDIEAAKRAGIAGALQVATGYGAAERRQRREIGEPNIRSPFRPIDRGRDDASNLNTSRCRVSSRQRASPATTPRLLYVVTEDWAFLSHRLPMARAARDAGFEVHVATRVSDGAAAIEAERFILHPSSVRARQPVSARDLFDDRSASPCAS